MNIDGSVFSCADGSTLLFQYSESALPIAHTNIQPPTSTAGYLTSTNKYKISKAQEELLMWHPVPRHYNTANTQKLMHIKGVDKESII